MTELHEELLQIADRLDRLAERGNDGAITEPLGALKEAVDKVGRAFGGSWLGYHANVYYAGLKLPPPGAHFSQEWGLMDTYGSARLGSHGDWLEYDSENVRNAVYELAGTMDYYVTQNPFHRLLGGGCVPGGVSGGFAPGGAGGGAPLFGGGG